MHEKIIKGFTSCVIALTLSACGGGDDGSSTVVVNETKTISEGYYVSYTLDAGTYTAEITASNNGVKVAWVGGSCTNSDEVKSYKSTCQLTTKGQLTVTNPTVFGLGGDEITTIKVSKE
jgi:hypothetical protein